MIMYDLVLEELLFTGGACYITPHNLKIGDIVYQSSIANEWSSKRSKHQYDVLFSIVVCKSQTIPGVILALSELGMQEIDFKQGRIPVLISNK